MQRLMDTARRTLNGERRRVVSVATLLLLAGAAVRGETPSSAQQALVARLVPMKEVHTLKARFLCEKRLALLESPLESSGQVWIRRGEEAADNGVRFSTEKPYVSELILTDGKVYARSQHEEEWAKSNQSSRPGLTAVMNELGAWATGDVGQITDMYSVAAGEAGAAIPAAPGADFFKGTRPDAEIFLLTPTNADLAKAVKRITLGLDRKTGTLVYLEILTEQEDATRYWFGDVQTNGELPAGIFEPKNAAAATAP